MGGVIGLLHDQRIKQLEVRIRELEAEVERMKPLVEILGIWRGGQRRTPDGEWVEGEMVARYDTYEASQPK